MRGARYDYIWLFFAYGGEYHIHKKQADKSKLFPSRRVLTKSLQRKKNKCVSLSRQIQQLQEEISFLQRKLQDGQRLHESIMEKQRQKVRHDMFTCLNHVDFLQGELERLPGIIRIPLATFGELQSARAGFEATFRDYYIQREIEAVVDRFFMNILTETV